MDGDPETAVAADLRLNTFFPTANRASSAQLFWQQGSSTMLLGEVSQNSILPGLKEWARKGVHSVTMRIRSGRPWKARLRVSPVRCRSAWRWG